MPSVLLKLVTETWYDHSEKSINLIIGPWIPHYSTLQYLENLVPSIKTREPSWNICILGKKPSPPLLVSCVGVLQVTVPSTRGL